MSEGQGPASPGGTPPAANASQVVLVNDVLLFAKSFIKGKPGDYINEVRFGSPVTLTRIVMACPATASDGRHPQQQPLVPLLRAFARDLLYPGSARYAPLCPSNLSVAPGQSNSVFTEPIVTDHVILRGRYTAVVVQLFGRAEYDSAAVVTAAVNGAAASAHPMDEEDVEHLRQQQQYLQQQQRPAAGRASGVHVSPGSKRPRLLQAPLSIPLWQREEMSREDEPGGEVRGWVAAEGVGKDGKGLVKDGAPLLAPQLIPPGSSLLPLDHVPRPLLAALRAAAEYYGEVGRSHGRIAMNPPAGRLAPVMAAAKHVCRALAGQTAELEMNLAAAAPSEMPPLAPGELESLCDMTCEWGLLLASGRSSKVDELNVGLAGMAAAVLLAICTPSAPLLMAMGAAAQVVRALCLPNPPADLVRLAVACCDALTLTCPAPAAEVLLARYRPPPPQPPKGGGAAAGAGVDGVLEEKTEVKVKREADVTTARQAVDDMQVGPDAWDGMKMEEGDGGTGGAQYGDGQVCGGEDSGAEEGGSGGTVRRRSSTSGGDGGGNFGANGGGGDEEKDGGDGNDADDSDRARLLPAGSGALTRAASGAVVASEDALMEDELYAGYYDSFEDEYYAGGEEDYAAPEAIAAAAGTGVDDHDGGDGHTDGDLDTKLPGQDAAASGGDVGGDNDGDNYNRRRSSSSGCGGSDNTSSESASDGEKSDHRSGGSPGRAQPLESLEGYEDGGLRTGAAHNQGRGEVAATQERASTALTYPSPTHAMAFLEDRMAHSRGTGPVQLDSGKDQGAGANIGGVKGRSGDVGGGRGLSPRGKGRDRDRGHDRDQERDRESDRRRERASSRDHRDRGSERRRRRRGRSKSRSRSRSRTRSKVSRATRSRSQAKRDARGMGGMTTEASTQPQPRQELPPLSAAIPLLTVMLRRPRAPAVAVAVARVMRRLTVADLVGQCTVACQTLLTTAPVIGGAASGAAAAAAAVMEAMLPLRQLAAILPDLAEAAASGTGGAVSGTTGTRIPLLGSVLSAVVNHVGNRGDSRPAVPEPPALDPGVVQILAARSLFMSLAGALGSVHMHAGVLRKGMETTAAAAALLSAGSTEAAAAAAAQQAALYAQSHFQAAHQALLVGIRMLLTPLLSTPTGLALVTAPASRAGVAALITALDPTAQDAAVVATGAGALAVRRAVTTAAATAAAEAGGGSGAGPAAELAAMLCDALSADAAVRSLAGASASGVQGVVLPEQAAIYGPMGPSILTLLHMCTGSEPGRQAAVLALSSSRPALSTLLRAVRARPRAVKALAAAAAGTGVHATGDLHGCVRGSLLYDEDDEHDTSFQAESLYGSTLLLWVVRDTRLQALAGWLPIAGAIADAARVEAELLASGTNAALLAAIGCDAELVRRGAKELQGRAEAGVALMTGGVAALLRVLEESLPRLEAVGTSDTSAPQQFRIGRAPRGVDPRAAVALVRAGSEQRAAAATASLELLAVLLHDGSSAGRTMGAQLYVQGALGVLERCVRSSTAAVRATAHDAAWAHAAGDALDATERAKNRRTATSLLAAALHATSALLLALRPLAATSTTPGDTGVTTATNGLRLRNRGIVDALLAAHAVTVLSCDSLAAALAGGAAAGTSGVPGAPSGSYELLPARLAAAAALAGWIEASWEPPVLPAAFGLAHSYRKEAVAHKAHMGLGHILSIAASVAGSESGAAADGTSGSAGAAAVGPEREPASTSLSPELGYCLISFLGDLFPREWPPPPTPGQPPNAALPPPTNMAKRSLLASALETVLGQFLRLLSFGYNSESRLVRCATVRMVVKAAGLGGGMPTFLAAPLVEALATLVRGGGAGVGNAVAPALTDARRLLEVLAPLAYKATIKAALLDARAVSCLSRFIHKLISSTVGGAAAGALGAAEAVEVPVVTGQALEALRLLADPDLSLSPGAARETRQREDVPSVAEATPMVTALLSCLPYLGVNASLAAALLVGPSFGLSTYAAGRAALRQGAMKWHSAQAGIGAGSGSDLGRLVEALRWAAGRLRSSAESARSSAAAGGSAAQEGAVVAAACCEVAAKLDEVAVATTEADLDTDFPPPLPAPQRFVAAVAAATEAAAAAAAEVVGAASGSAAAAAAAAAAVAAADATEAEAGEALCCGSPWPWPAVCDNATQSFWRYCRARVVRGNVSKKLARWDCGASGAHISVSSLLPLEPLSRRRRPRDVPRPAAAVTKAPAAGDGAATGSVSCAATGRSLGRAADGAPAGGAPDDDIPVVTAPRRRGDMRARGSSSRAPSKHVDDYQRMAAAAPSSALVMTPNGPPSVPAPAESRASPPVGGSGPRVSMGPPPPRPPPGPPPPGTGGVPLPGPPSMGVGMGSFRPQALQPLPSADADSLYDDLFAPTPGSTGGSMGRSQSGGGSALPGRSSSGSGPLAGAGSLGSGSGGLPPPPPLPPQQQQQRRAQQVQQQQPLHQSMQSARQQQQHGAMAGPSAAASAAGGMTSQQLVTLLRDPDKLRVLLATNPALAAIIAQSASSMGLNLPSLHR